MVEQTLTNLSGRGTIRNGAVVLDVPLDLPEGTEVEVRIEVSKPAPTPASVPYAPAGRSDISNEELLRLAEKYPPPKEWLDATDDPFQP
jgi:hypothetical protein